MPIVTEAMQGRKRKLWPLGLATGVVVLLLGACAVVPAVRPVYLSYGSHYLTIRGSLDAGAAVAGYSDSRVNPSGNYIGELDVQLGPFRYRFSYLRQGP
jgi:hypothetical protein